MNFDDLVAPLSRDDFLERYLDGSCFVLRGTADKFLHLITLEEIENRLNDGCNLNAPVNIIGRDGSRRELVSRAVSWSALAVQKKQILEHLQSGHSFMMTNLSQINHRVSRLLDEIETVLSRDNLHGDLHLYVSSRKEATAYNAHRDFPQHKLYLQVLGSTEWRVYHHDPELPENTRAIPADEESRYLDEAGHFTLEQGDLFYMPPAVFHKVRNVGGPRISFSLPLSPGGERHRMDRTYIPLREIFETGFVDEAADEHVA